ncbi:MAG TPA: hybrid sensor histidine kinase/response regulator [Cytophagaceae bacterium]
MMNQVIKILLVDDDEEDFMLTRDIIDEIPHRKYHLDWVSTYEEAMESIRKKNHDVYLIDYRLGAKTGIDIIKEAIASGCGCPLILLTGQGDIEIDEKATKAGAADYLVKGNINPYQLERSIRYSIRDAKNLAQIRNLNSELEKRVAERTEELNNAIEKLEKINLQQKKHEEEIKKALIKERELNELKSRFVTVASHEFRTPLSTILSSASLIAKYNGPNDDEKRLKHINRIKSAVTNLTGILNDFLSISKLEEGKENNNPVELDISEFIFEVVEELQAVVLDNQSVKYCHLSDESEVKLDKQILKNILINLISNAIKYSPNGEDIDVTSEIKNRVLTIAVKDKGIGIPEADQQHLFSRFFRAKNAGNIQGTGLGLNIVKKYVDLLKGTIEFRSKENKGTTFIVTIPF